MENRTTSLNPVPLYCCAVLTFASTADHLQTVCVPQLLWAFIAPSVTWCSVMSLGILCRNHIGYAFVYLYGMWSSPLASQDAFSYNSTIMFMGPALVPFN